MAPFSPTAITVGEVLQTPSPIRAETAKSEGDNTSSVGGLLGANASYGISLDIHLQTLPSGVVLAGVNIRGVETLPEPAMAGPDYDYQVLGPDESSENHYDH